MKTQKTTQIFVLFFTFLALTRMILLSPNIHAEMGKVSSDSAMALPEPPAENPHPPVTEQDKKRVAFADEVIKKILMMDMSDFVVDNLPVIANNDSTVDLKIKAACLADPACLKNNKTALNYIYSINQMYGKVIEFRHTHVIPWAFENFEKNKTSVNQNETEQLTATPTKKYTEQKAAQESMPTPSLKKDEYMLHSFVKFGKDYRWHHVDLVVSEDAKGNLEFRRFFIIKMPLNSDDLPPGAVC